MILAKEQESQMPKKVEFNTATALSLAFKIFDKQGYVKTGHYYSSDEKIRPNKEVLSAELEKNPFDVIHPSVEKLSDMQKDLFFKKMGLPLIIPDTMTFISSCP